MKLHRLSLLALSLAPPALVPLATAGPATAVRADSPAAAYVVDDWADSGPTLPAGPYTRVEVTYDATYAIRPDGQVQSVVPWFNDQGLVAPSFDRPIVDVTGGTHFGMALDDEGRLHQWGQPLDVPVEDQALTYRDVSAAEVGAVGVTTDGEVRYWGAAASRYAFDAAELADADVVSVDVDSWSAVAITTEGRVLSGGAPINGAWDPAWVFPSDRSGETFVAADAGYEFAVALTTEGEVVAWGPGGRGETTVPVLPAGRHAVAVSAGLWMAAAVLDDGSVVSWGQPERTVVVTQRPGVPVVDIDLERYRSAVTYATLSPTAVPIISDTAPIFGDTLAATAGTWPIAPDALHYEWRAHDASGGSAVVGTDSASYAPTAADADRGVALTVTVTATKDGHVSGTATSRPTEPVAALPFDIGPTLTVTGEPTVGKALHAAATTASPTPGSTTWAWFAVEDGAQPEDTTAEPIAGASTADLAITPDLAGRSVLLRHTVRRPGYAPTSVESEVIAVGTGVLAPPSVTVAGTPRTGQVLTAVVDGDPATTSTSYQWLRGSTLIPGATDRSYRPVADDVGTRLRVRVTSSAVGYDAARATSASTPAVQLGAARLRVAVPSTARVGTRATIKVTGLANGERFTVTVAGKRVAGKATSAGVGTVRVPVSGRPGSRPVTVVGSLPDRKGTATLRVVKG